MEKNYIKLFLISGKPDTGYTRSFMSVGLNLIRLFSIYSGVAQFYAFKTIYYVGSELHMDYFVCMLKLRNRDRFPLKLKKPRTCALGVNFWGARLL